jgi:hypothetical protein
MGFSPLKKYERHLALAEIIYDIILFWAEALIFSIFHYNALKPVAIQIIYIRNKTPIYN